MHNATAYGHAQGEAYMLMTYERALDRRRDYVHRWWDDPDIPMRDHHMLGPLGPEGAAARLARGDLEQFGPGTPDLIEVTSDVQQWLQGGGY
jgi:hypothetical protein